MADLNGYHILLIEDELSLGTIIKETLEGKGLHVFLAVSLQKAYRHISQQHTDLFIVDVMLPDGDGFQFVKQLRMQKIFQPVIFLTSRALPEDVIKGFESGANDYIKKPFSLAELLVRIKYQLQIVQPHTNEDTKQIFHLGAISFHYPAGILKNKETRRQLTSRDADILYLLVTASSEGVDRTHILRQLWGESGYFAGRSLDVFISKLRKYLSVDPSVAIINIRGKGYRLVY